MCLSNNIFEILSATEVFLVSELKNAENIPSSVVIISGGSFLGAWLKSVLLSVLRKKKKRIAEENFYAVATQVGAVTLLSCIP